jgi:ABC-type amino acid transport system permease subunit
MAVASSVAILPIRFAFYDARLRAVILPQQVRWVMPMTLGEAYGLIKLLRLSGIAALPKWAAAVQQQISRRSTGIRAI